MKWEIIKMQEFKRNSRVLFLGLESSGKSLLIKRLQCINKDVKDKTQFDEHTSTQPTTGFDTKVLLKSGKEFSINEVGSSMLANWNAFILDSQTIIFVIDLENRPQLSQAAFELDMLANVHLADKSIPILVVFNKQDRCLERSIGDQRFIEQMFEDSFEKVDIMYASALTGEGCMQVHEWIMTELHKQQKSSKQSKASCCASLFD
ncbi:hypothetical protein FGO68_gene15256 [Halteria grandinella]|uniref:ADP-ribosylation factor-like protein n=1 Tax=Halteria grandinella TaxID=5974 RepID=A0A8J8NBW9_HALGN|nr:hypothetical protein FGO68_gene15256 [Halteria grandinella]